LPSRGCVSWNPRRFEWTAPFHSKTKTSLCAIDITFRTSFKCGDELSGSINCGEFFSSRIWLVIFSRTLRMEWLTMAPMEQPTLLQLCESGESVAETDRPQMTKYGASALHAVYPTLQTHTQNMQYSLICHCNNRWTNSPQCYGIALLCVHCCLTCQLPDCGLDDSIRKVLRPATLAQVFHGFPVSKS
jgi:hypothetical protein